jgi:hypothetical protein
VTSFESVRFLTAIRQWRTIQTSELIETSIFTRQIAALLSDDEYRGLQSRIAANPELGAIIKGGGCIRKGSRCRWIARKEWWRPRHILLGCSKGCDPAALRLSEKRSSGSDSEPSFAARQSRQKGVWK